MSTYWDEEIKEESEPSVRESIHMHMESFERQRGYTMNLVSVHEEEKDEMFNIQDNSKKSSKYTLQDDPHRSFVPAKTQPPLSFQKDQARIRVSPNAHILLSAKMQRFTALSMCAE